MIVVSDTSAISNLILINRLELLKSVFGKVLIPVKVYSEITALENFNVDLSNFKESDFIEVKEISNMNLFNNLIVNLDSGESGAIVLAKEFQIKTIGLIGVLIKAKEMKIIYSVKEILEELRNTAGFWISQNLYLEYNILLMNRFYKIISYYKFCL